MVDNANQRKRIGKLNGIFYGNLINRSIRTYLTRKCILDYCAYILYRIIVADKSDEIFEFRSIIQQAKINPLNPSVQIFESG